MAIKFEKIEPGMELLDIHREHRGRTLMEIFGDSSIGSSRVGNTREWVLWNVQVISVDRAARTAVVSWNNNRNETWSAKRLQGLYTKPTKAYLAQQARRDRGEWL